jgi:periplasmic divalent cation tolerance protein
VSLAEPCHLGRINHAGAELNSALAADHWGGTVSDENSTVITAIDNAEAAAELARGIVEARLAACAQIIGPIRSFYRWQGSVHDEQEWQCWAKTNTDRVAELKEYIKKNHSYDVPEVIVLPIVDGSIEYLKWLTDETRPE